MKRKKSQILYNFLLDDTFDHSENGVIGRVISIDDDDSTNTTELPIHYILNRIRPQLSDWKEAPQFRPGDVDLVVPDDVEFEVFPRNFECRRCGTVNTFTKSDFESYSLGDENSNVNPVGRCEECGKELRDTDQQQLVTVCQCGDIDTIYVPSHCDDKGTQLIRTGSAVSQAEWVCQCGQRLGGLIRRRPSCDTCGEKRTNVHSASTCFYPHTASFVNIQSEDIDLIRGSQRFRVNQILDYLLGEKGDSNSSASDELDAQTQAALEQMSEEAAEEFQQARTEVSQQREEKREEKRSTIKSQFADDQLIAIGEEVFEYHSILSDDVYSSNLDDLYEEAKERRDLRAPTIANYQDQRDDLNLTEVKLIENFPITSTVFGYSRLTPQPEENVRMRPFIDPENGDQEIYLRISEAEALMVSLDKEKVIKWLLENTVIDERPEQDPREWFLAELSPDRARPVYPYYDEIEESEIARHCLVLLHSLSHAFINTIDALSGYSKNSLVEYTLPRTLSFVVYKRSDTDFNLGSIFTLVENQFPQVYDYLTDDAQECIYDPVCEREENSSCEGCLYISGLSCSHGNRNLARSTVYGGQFDDQHITGFFDV